MLTLYQFPISHYCEKIRWALDYKNLDYAIKNLLPGPHVFTTKKLCKESTLPILVHDKNIIQNSSDIIDYLDQTFPQQPLTPQPADLKNEALEWEDYVDREIGIHIRRYCYAFLLKQPAIVIPYFTHQGPWYGKLLMSVLFPKLKKVMTHSLKINPKTTASSKTRLVKAVEKIDARLQDHPYLVGDTFSRADLAAAALLAPLCQPDQYGLDWPERQPEPIENLVDELGEKLR